MSHDQVATVPAPARECQGLRRLLGNLLIRQRVLPVRLRNSWLALLGVDFRAGQLGRGTRIDCARLRVGDSTYFNDGVVIETAGWVSIGNAVAFGQQVLVCTSTHAIGPPGHRATHPSHALPVSIGDGVWVGARTTILPGAVIGPGCVVAAGSVVTGELAANGLYGGVPATLIRTLPGGDAGVG